MKSNIFTNAWDLFRTGNYNTFAEALKKSWYLRNRFGRMNLPESSFDAQLRAIKQSGYFKIA